MWINVKEKLPEIGFEVLCKTRKFGFAQNKVETDSNELLWWNGQRWEDYDVDDFENNPDYIAVIYWMEIPSL